MAGTAAGLENFLLPAAQMARRSGRKMNFRSKYIGTKSEFSAEVVRKVTGVYEIAPCTLAIKVRLFSVVLRSHMKNTKRSLNKGGDVMK